VSARPTPGEERWIAAAARLGLDRATPWLAARTGGWNAVGWITRCALFALGAVAAGLTTAIASLVRAPGPLLLAGVTLVAVAEWLARARRFFRAGVEEALGAGGLVLIAFAIANPGNDAHGIKSCLLFATALLVAGLRFLNPLFTTLALAALSLAAQLVVQALARDGQSHTVAPACVCFATALVALAGGAVRFERPSHDRMLDWLVVVMPLGCYLWLAGGHIADGPGGPAPFATVAGALAVLAPAILGVLALVAGLARRSHAPLLAAMLCVACLAYELRNLTGLPLEVRLIAWGSAALVLAVALDRYLRTPRAGITSARVGDDGESLARLELVGAGALAAPAAAPAAAPPGFKGGGGRFDGGGASGGY